LGRFAFHGVFPFNFPVGLPRDCELRHNRLLNRQIAMFNLAALAVWNSQLVGFQYFNSRCQPLAPYKLNKVKQCAVLAPTRTTL
jgi:hypothetical protein